jgi:fatty acid synthase subunit alpha, fungi type
MAHGSKSKTPLAYLASVPISYPLISLTQLVQYLIVCRVANLTPDELRKRLAGVTGHSQGLCSAITIAASSTHASFVESVEKVLTWSFFLSLRGQDAFPVLALEPSIVKDSIEGGEETATPVLSVTSLVLKDLEAHIKKTNEHLPDN